MESSAATDHASPSSRRGRRWMLPGLVAAVMMGAAVYFAIPQAPLEWAKRHEWKTQPVYKTDLKRSIGRGWRNLPFEVPAAEEGHIKRCMELMRLNNSTVNDKTLFGEPAVREELESILRQQPGLFYAEYALGLWHKLHGQGADAEPFFAVAYRHAPVVLVQTYQHEDGTPLANAAVGSVEIECNRVRDGSLDPSLHLLFAAQVTDERGRIYLPVYDTVYRVTAISHPTGYSMDVPALGWFESGKAGLLPAAVVRAKGDVGAPK